MQKRQGTTVIICTHDHEIIDGFADRKIRLKKNPQVKNAVLPPSRMPKHEPIL